MPNKHVTIPAELIPELEAWGKSTASLFGKLRSRSGLTPKGVTEDQAWFWSKRWQKMEREADEDIANGDVVQCSNMDEAIKYLNQLV